MKIARALIILCTLLIPSAVLAFTTQDVIYIRARLDRSSILAKEIGITYTVTGAGEDYLDLMIPRSELSELAAKLSSYEVVYNSQGEKIGETFGTNFEDYFHDYDETVQIMIQAAENHPDIVRVDTLGYSVENRMIMAAIVTDNPDIEEDEPEFRVLGLHHGDELMSTEVNLALLEHLTENYGVDPTITSLVDELEIWIIPMMNPDGRMATPYPIRWNANGVDLNRDYGYLWNENTPSVFSQPETRAIRRNGLENNFMLSLSFHTSGEIVNYVWNYSGVPPPDSVLIKQLSNEYGSFNDYWVVDGYYWYQTHGDCNDWSYGARSSIDWTIEVPDNNFAAVWNNNRDAIITLMAHAKEGIRGQVTDAQSGQPIEALITVEETGYLSYNDPALGDYHRLLLPGSYTVTFSSPGYADTTVAGITVTSSDATVLDIALRKGGENFPSHIVSCFFYDPFSWPDEYLRNPSNANQAFGYPDGISASLGEGGNIVLDFGETRPVPNMEGDDFTVYEEDPPDGYSVLLSNTFNGPWTQLDTGFGTASFDIGTAGFNTARYVKIIDDNDGDPYAWYPGCDIDAIVATPLADEVTLIHDDHFIDDTAHGDGDGILDPGERVDIWVTLANLGTIEGTGISARLSTRNTMITVSSGEALYPDIPGGGRGTSMTPYTLSVSSEFPEGVSASFYLEISEDTGHLFEDSFSVQIGSPPILLVDDDDGEGYETYFTYALNEAGYMYDTWETASQGAPSGFDISDYNVVIWTTGESTEGTLTPDDRENLSTFLDAGGNLFLSSQDYLYESGIDSFASDYLHVAWNNSDVEVTEITGIEGDPISSGFHITLTYPPDFSNWSDDLLPDSLAAGVFENTGYAGGGNRMAGYFGATRYPGSGTDYFKTIFFAVPFEAIPIDGSSVMLMKNILEWFGEEAPVAVDNNSTDPPAGSLPRAFTLFQNYPNPFNPTTMISFDIPDDSGRKQYAQLTIYNVRGRRVKTLIDSELEPGHHRMTWDGRNERGDTVSSGVYLYTLVSSGKRHTKKMILLR